ncbi:DUF302 domain-containing protein [Calditerricola satsumensis]|uniref:DUF302 domain-containing protein n=1 Tax=Calditerricola satsumensis TaxID=373054 RepID=A0A8J3FCY6_9BACI|nr:DUF302 domain-containing protein [Calditerricola satsumensis]GGJ93825.1 hypothetical protein GCM10007043_04420 [Calditerricola satsumensis]
MEGFAIRFTTERSLEDVRERLREALAKRGFGVLWELDVAETLAKKGQPVAGPFVVWEVCKPAVAAEALAENADAVFLLPCKLGAYARDGRTVVGMIRPTHLASPFGERLAAIGRDVEEELVAALREATQDA